MDKRVRVFIGVLLLFISVVVLIIFFIIGTLSNGSSANSPSKDSDFPIVILVPIFFGAFLPIIAAIKKQR